MAPHVGEKKVIHAKGNVTGFDWTKVQAYHSKYGIEYLRSQDDTTIDGAIEVLEDYAYVRCLGCGEVKYGPMRWWKGSKDCGCEQWDGRKRGRPAGRSLEEVTKAAASVKQVGRNLGEMIPTSDRVMNSPPLVPRAPGVSPGGIGAFRSNAGRSRRYEEVGRPCSFYVPIGLHEKFKEFCLYNRLSNSAVVTELIRQYLEVNWPKQEGEDGQG